MGFVDQVALRRLAYIENGLLCRHLSGTLSRYFLVKEIIYLQQTFLLFMPKHISRKEFIRNTGLMALGFPAFSVAIGRDFPIHLNKQFLSRSGGPDFRNIHPGILNSTEDLIYVKATVLSSDPHPIKTGYQQMLSTNYANLDYQSKAFVNVRVKGSGSTEMEDHFREDGLAAYAHALLWVISGDERHSNKSLEIMNLWARTCKGLYCPEHKTQPTLEASWALPIWACAAEIIRHYGDGRAGWLPTDVSKFEEFIKMMADMAGGAIAKAPNWHVSRALARMAAGVFLNDSSLYEQGYTGAIHQIDLIGTDGKPSENSRDFGHCQYNVIGTAQCAEIAFHQGDNSLYLRRHEGEAMTMKPLIFRQSEYFVREVMGQVPLGGIDYSSAKSKHSPPYEMVLMRYQHDFGMPMRYTEEFVMNYNRPADGRENHFIGWTTLTHAR